MEQREGYLDFHCHILPGIDDGSKDWDMTGAMLELSYRQGVRTMIATPHFYPGHVGYDAQSLQNLVAQTDAMAKEIDASMQVLAGNEILYSENIVQELRAGNALSMAGSRYVLVEFLPQERKSRIEQGIRELLEAGYAPVIAHVERVNEIFGNEFFAEHIHGMGAYMQVNTESLMGGLFDKQSKKAKKWIERGYVQFLGSDSHNTQSRAPLMGDAIDKLYKSISPVSVENVIYRNQQLFLDKKFI